MTTLAPVIAIDGPSGSGKGTIAGILARKLGWCLLDSGALYRLLAFAARNHGVDLANEDALKMLAAHLDVQFIAAAEGHGQRIILEGEEVTESIRNEQIGADVFFWSANPPPPPPVTTLLHSTPPCRPPALPCAKPCCSASAPFAKRRA